MAAGEEFFAPSEVYVGRDLGGRRVAVTPEMVALYGDGTGDRSDRGATNGGSFAPALLFHSEVYRDLSWYLPNLIGNLHARQEWELFHPFRVGDVVCTRSTVVERYRKRRRDYVVNEVLITDSDGRWLQRSRTHQSFLAEVAADDIVHDKDRERQPERKLRHWRSRRRAAAARVQGSDARDVPRLLGPASGTTTPIPRWRGRSVFRTWSSRE